MPENGLLIPSVNRAELGRGMLRKLLETIRILEVLQGYDLLTTS